MMPTVRRGSRDQDRGEQQGHQQRKARGPGAWLRGGGHFPGRRQVGQQGAEVALGPRGQGLRDPLIELGLVESALLEVLPQFGRHRITLGVGHPQVWRPSSASWYCVLPGLVHVNSPGLCQRCRDGGSPR